MVVDHQAEYSSQWAAISSINAKSAVRILASLVNDGSSFSASIPVSGAMSKIFWLRMFFLGSFAAAASASAGEVLTSDTYTLTVNAHCEEGEVGCADLTATLLDNSAGTKTELVGFTYMVKCGDRVTPCHVGFYDLRSPSVSVRAYPDGKLEVESRGSKSAHVNERGVWSY